MIVSAGRSSELAADYAEGREKEALSGPVFRSSATAAYYPSPAPAGIATSTQTARRSEAEKPFPIDDGTNPNTPVSRLGPANRGREAE